MNQRDFSHDSTFTDYMATVEKIVTREGHAGQKVLDMPAGNGLFADRLRSQGFEVTCGDINRERPDYVYVNMEQPLPFADETFDFAICMEGVEHVINPSLLIAELSRVVKKGGRVIITTPNLQNMYSRLKFLLTGEFYQYNPELAQHPRGRLIDRGHIAPMNFSTLNYIFGEHQLTPEPPRESRRLVGLSAHADTADCSVSWR